MSKLNIIVPYRNRKDHLNVFTNIMFSFLNKIGIESFELYIVEQCDEQEFNRGCLLNIGFLETEDGKNNYYCFNDIDTLPKSLKANYYKPPNNSIYHPYGHWHSISNFFLINSDTYRMMNGFSTKYWNWGFEDEDFMIRTKLNKVQILRDNFQERFESGMYYELDVQSDEDLAEKMSHINAQVNEIIFKNTVLNPETTLLDGLNTTQYTILERKKYDKYTLLKSRIENNNQNLKKINSLRDYYDYVDIFNPYIN